jgi:uncharacterized membrane protein
VTTSSGTSRCQSENAVTGSRISCDFYGFDDEKPTIRMFFMSRGVVKRTGEKYEFRAAFPVTMPVRKMVATVRLPQKSTLSTDVANESFFPPDGGIITDGKRLIVTWVRDEGISPNENLSFSVIFEMAGTGGTTWDLLIFSMVLIVVIAMAGIAVYVRRGAPAEKGEVKVLPLLNKDEKKIVDIIAKKGGSARQRDIVKEADCSKAKVSRLIKSLKERGVVDVEAISGRENKVILKIKGIG